MSSIEAVSYLCLAVWMVHLGRRLQQEQDAEDALTGRNPDAPPPRITLGAPPPGCILPTEGKASEPGGIPNVDRLRLERLL